MSPSLKSIAGRRTQVVYRLLLKGWDRAQIHEAVHKQYRWNAATRTIDGYIAAAKALIDEVAEDADRKFELGRTLARYHDLFARCHAKGDYRGCRLILGDVTALLKLDELTDDDRDEIERFLDAIDGGTP